MIVLLQLDVFDRLILNWTGLHRQHLYACMNTGKTTWRNVPLFESGAGPFPFLYSTKKKK